MVCVFLVPASVKRSLHTLFHFYWAFRSEKYKDLFTLADEEHEYTPPPMILLFRPTHIFQKISVLLRSLAAFGG